MLYAYANPNKLCRAVQFVFEQSCNRSFLNAKLWFMVIQ